MEAPEGGEALFECQLSQPEVAAQTWLLDDEPVHTSDSAEVVYFEGGLRHLLLLKNLHPRDSCRVTFLAGDLVSSAFLTVRGDCGVLGAAPPPAHPPTHPFSQHPHPAAGWRLEFLETPQDVVVTTGAQAHFNCMLSEPVPVGEASWYLEGTTLQPDDPDWTVTADGSHHSLLLHHAQPHHAGEVTFAARDAVASARLSVLSEAPPQIGSGGCLPASVWSRGGDAGCVPGYARPRRQGGPQAGSPYLPAGPVTLEGPCWSFSMCPEPSPRVGSVRVSIL